MIESHVLEEWIHVCGCDAGPLGSKHVIEAYVTPASFAYTPRPVLARQERRFPEAFSALSEAVKHKRGSWQTWANYAHAALQTGHPLQAARGVTQACESLLFCSACGTLQGSQHLHAAGWARGGFFKSTACQQHPQPHLPSIPELRNSPESTLWSRSTEMWAQHTDAHLWGSLLSR